MTTRRLPIAQLTPDQLDRAWMESEGWSLLLVTHQHRPAMPMWLLDAIDSACGAYWVHEMRQEVRGAQVEGVTRQTQRGYRPHLDDVLLVRLMQKYKVSLRAPDRPDDEPWVAILVDRKDVLAGTPHVAVLELIVTLRYPLGYDVKE